MKTYFSRPTEIRDPTDIFYLQGILKTCLIICNAKLYLGMEQGKFWNKDCPRLSGNVGELTQSIKDTRNKTKNLKRQYG